MACVYSIVAYGEDAAALPRSVEAALDEVDRIDRLMSHYRPESPLSEVNREAAHRPVPVDPELLAFLAECLGWSERTEGAFDVTVGPLMKAWGFFRGEGRLPEGRALAAAREGVGFRHLRLDPVRRTVSFARPGVELDLGGIAKGYAVDRATEVLRKHGVHAALVSAGGSSVFGLGAPPGRKGWRVALEDPLRPGRGARTVWLKDQALSVAGLGPRRFEAGGRSYGHVMDPRTGEPAPGVLGVAVLGGRATAGDALDDALFVLGLDGSRRLLPGLPVAEALFFLPGPGRGWRLARLRARPPGPRARTAPAAGS
jgi:thiamine biosynthesis lipoprotein